MQHSTLNPSCRRPPPKIQIAGGNHDDAREMCAAGWKLRNARSEYQMANGSEETKNARISALLSEMRPRLSRDLNRKAHTTNVVDMAQRYGNNEVIYGSWQDRRPQKSTSQQQISSLPKYEQLYCNTNNMQDELISSSSSSVASSTLIVGDGLRKESSIGGGVGGASSTNMLCSAMGRRDPPEYKRIAMKSTWQKTCSETRPSQAGWMKQSRPLPKGALSPVSYFRELENRNGIGGSCLSVAIAQEKPAQNRICNPCSDEKTTLNRSTPRQASFMAAIAKNKLKEGGDADEEDDQRDVSTTSIETPLRRPRGRENSTKFRQSSKSMGKLDFNSLTNEESGKENCEKESKKERRQKSADNLGKAAETSGSIDSNHNEEMKMIRRARPKSYVLATSTSIQDDVLATISNEPSSSISHDGTTSREMPSSLMGSSSSIENRPQQHTSRSLNAPHPPATHRLHKFIALFNKHEDGGKKSRVKRSRTSLPASRFSLPGLILQRDGIERQTWVKYQEIALGKAGKRNHWEDRWAILCKRNLYVCVESPSFASDTTIELGAHTRVDVKNAIVDIAYDWLSSTFSKQRHVVRIVTQDRCEHLIELNTESEMLSWISVLQSSSEEADCKVNNVKMNGAANGKENAHLQNSHSIASIASSSCSTTTSDFVAPTATTTSRAIEARTPDHPLNQTGLLATSKSVGALNSTANCGGESGVTDCAKNRLIMHRYIAKNSQLQSPTANKKMEVTASTSGLTQACATHAGTSRDSLDHNNGGVENSTTPKSDRKWKKSKAAKQASAGSSTSSGQQSVLGVRLAECPSGSNGVPLLVQICVSVVETHGMDTIGIYRIPGNTAAVNALKESLSNRGYENVSPQNVEALDPRWRDVNVVSSLLKMFLRKLPEPLLTDKLYPFFIDANRISSHHNRLHKLRNLLRKLPKPHYETLRFLILHLAEITKHSDVNKMECRNLALMFGPSIVRPSDDNMATMVTHMSDQCKIIETLIHYNSWMFDESSTAEDSVPEQNPADGPNCVEPGSYGVGVPAGVSAASFNDMHNLIRKANEDQAAAMMNEGKGTKIKNMLRRNSRRDKSKSKIKIESTAPAATHPKWQQPTPSSQSAASVESAFCGNYQERDIDAEIESRQNAASPPSNAIEQSPSLESSLGSLPDTSRTEPIGFGGEEAKEAARRKRQEEMYSARRIFIAGTEGVPEASVDALANHSQHLNIASSPALEVLSEETREKIRKMQQKKQNWHMPEVKAEFLKTYSPTKDMTDALSCTSDYSTTSSAPLSSTNPPLAVACTDQPNSSSDYASSDPSPCARNSSTSPASRPSNLGLIQEPLPINRSQKIRLRTKTGHRDPARRHTLTDVDTLKHGRLDKLARWFGIRKSNPDVTRDESSLDGDDDEEHSKVAQPPLIVRTSPNELTPVSGDEQL